MNNKNNSMNPLSIQYEKQNSKYYEQKNHAKRDFFVSDRVRDPSFDERSSSNDNENRSLQSNSNQNNKHIEFDKSNYKFTFLNISIWIWVIIIIMVIILIIFLYITYPSSKLSNNIPSPLPSPLPPSDIKPIDNTPIIVRENYNIMTTTINNTKWYLVFDISGLLLLSTDIDKYSRYNVQIKNNEPTLVKYGKTLFNLVSDINGQRVRIMTSDMLDPVKFANLVGSDVPMPRVNMVLPTFNISTDITNNKFLGTYNLVDDKGNMLYWKPKDSDIYDVAFMSSDQAKTGNWIYSPITTENINLINF